MCNMQMHVCMCLSYVNVHVCVGELSDYVIGNIRSYIVFTYKHTLYERHA